MTEDERLDQLAKKAAYQVLQAFELFKNEPKHIRDQAPNIILSRVNAMLYGGKSITIEDDGTIVTVLEPAAESSINTDETPPGESSEAV